VWFVGHKNRGARKIALVHTDVFSE